MATFKCASDSRAGRARVHSGTSGTIGARERVYVAHTRGKAARQRLLWWLSGTEATHAGLSCPRLVTHAQTRKPALLSLGHN